MQEFNSTTIQAYYNFKVDIAVIFGADRSRAENEMKNVLEFEVALANVINSLNHN